MKKTIAALSLLAITTAAQAGSPWVKVATVWHDGFWYNPNSTRTVGISTSTDVLTKNMYGTTVFRYHVDCNRWEYVLRWQDGSISQTNPIPPESAYNTIAEKICK